VQVQADAENGLFVLRTIDGSDVSFRPGDVVELTVAPEEVANVGMASLTR
jgi:hypothetical protein